MGELASRETKVHKDPRARTAPVDPRDHSETRETKENRDCVANPAQLDNKENKVYQVLMVLMVHLVQKVHKEVQVSQASQGHKAHKDDGVLPENAVHEDPKATPEKRENRPLNWDPQVLTDDQDHRVLLDNEVAMVLMVFKGQEDHKDQEESLAWLAHQAITITTNCASSSLKS